MLGRLTLNRRAGRAALAAAAALAALAAPAVAQADAVTEWNANAANALIGTAGQPPQAGIPHLAMVHGAVYDAVNAIDGGHEGYLLTSRVGQPFDSQEAAAATAAYRVLLHLVPAQKDVLDAQYATSLGAIPAGSAKTRGIAVGDAAAAAMIAARTDDGRFGAFRFGVGSGPGVWRPVLPAFVNDPFAWLAEVRPFVVRSASQFHTQGAYKLTSRAYADDVAEVAEIGSATSTTRTADQTTAARYWAAGPHGSWSRMFRTIAASRPQSLAANARLFAGVYFAGADALITAWNEKGETPFWRPITAIREADTDGNPATTADPAWLPLIPTPPYPDHPSGLAALSGAFVAALQAGYATDEVAWSDTNPAGLTRSFTRFSQAIEEVVGARIWSGIHFRNADEQGATLGRQVAKYVERKVLRPVRSHEVD